MSEKVKLEDAKYIIYQWKEYGPLALEKIQEKVEGIDILQRAVNTALLCHDDINTLILDMEKQLMEAEATGNVEEV